MSFLPGMFPGGAVGGAAPLTTLSQVASATSTGQTIAGPAGILPRDLLVLYDFAFGITAPAQVVPTDFVPIASGTFTSGGGFRSTLSYKIATGAEASATLTGQNGTSANSKLLYVFRGDVPILTASPASVNGPSFTDGNPAAQNVTAGSGTPPLVVLGCYSGANVNPRTMSPAKDGEINVGNTDWLAYKIYNASPANVSVDMDDEGTANCLLSCYIACK